MNYYLRYIILENHYCYKIYNVILKSRYWEDKLRGFREAMRPSNMNSIELKFTKFYVEINTDQPRRRASGMAHFIHGNAY